MSLIKGLKKGVFRADLSYWHQPLSVADFTKSQGYKETFFHLKTAKK